MITQIRRFFKMSNTTLAGGTMTHGGAELSNRQICDMLEFYYHNNDLYRNLQDVFKAEGFWSPNMKALRNPTYAAVEFYAMTLWPGRLPDALPIQADNDRIIEPIHKVWKWGNWQIKKQLAARKFALTGDMFLQVATTDDKQRVYIQVVDPKIVTEHRVDERGFVVYLRTDVAKNNGPDQDDKFIRTEIWDKSGMVRYDHTEEIGAEVEDMGDVDLRVSNEDMGIDFVPWVWVPFRDIGDDRGLPLVWPAIGKIDELNLQATRLAELMFQYNKPDMVINSNMVDKEGRPMVAPSMKIKGENKTGGLEEIKLGEITLYRMPGLSDVKLLVPDIKWDAHAEQIMATIQEIERDIPEVKWYSVMNEGSGESGRALMLRMGPGIAKAEESRGNAEAALVRANAMALTLGSVLKLDGFTGIGTFDAGDFDHTFKPRPIIPLTDLDRAELAKTRKEAGFPASFQMRQDGASDEEIAKLYKDIQDTASAGAGPAKTATTPTEQGPLNEPDTTQVVKSLAVRDAAAAGTEIALADALDAAVADAVAELTRSGALAGLQ